MIYTGSAVHKISSLNNDVIWVSV